MDNLQKQMALKNFAKAGAFLTDNGSSDEEEIDGLAELPTIKDHKKSAAVNTNIKFAALELPTWERFFSNTFMFQARDYNFKIYYQLPKNVSCTETKTFPVLVFHHGAGSSGLTFALLCKRLYDQYGGQIGMLVYDARGHGNTEYCGDSTKEQDFSLEEFVQDELVILNHFYQAYVQPCFGETNIDKMKILLVGHSLGASIATNLNSLINNMGNGNPVIDYKDRIMGVVMLDIVEEAAIAALANMDHFLATTPNSFSTMNEAIEWHVNRGMPQKRDSAEVSIPPLFSRNIHRVTDLKKFERYWGSWFTGLSSKFVDLKTSKLLIIAGNEHLDKELIVGQMQGKYQLVVFQQSGHFIQEDCPVETAVTIHDFIQRNDNRSVVIKSNWGSSSST